MPDPNSAQSRNHSAPPPAFQQLVEQLGRLPGIGNRSAHRIAFHLLRSAPSESLDLAAALQRFKTDLKVCRICGNVSETDPCPICSDPQRDQSTILVVEQPTEIHGIESTGKYRGLYHVLMGRLAPLEGVGPGDLNLTPLLDRIEQNAATLKEIILGTNPTLEGDGTALYIQEKIEKHNIKLTRLARGLPTGSNLESVSKAVLSDALQGRRSMQ